MLDEVCGRAAAQHEGEGCDRNDKRLMPHTPWPLVQPLPKRVPKPTRSPATTSTAVEIANPESTVDGEPRIEVKADDVPPASSPEAARILRAIERANGNKVRAARALGMSRVTLWRRMKELGLAPTDSAAQD